MTTLVELEAIKKLINFKIKQHEQELEECRQTGSKASKPDSKEAFLKSFPDMIELRERIKFNLGAIGALKCLIEDLKEDKNGQK